MIGHCANAALLRSIKVNKQLPRWVEQCEHSIRAEHFLQCMKGGTLFACRVCEYAAKALCALPLAGARLSNSVFLRCSGSAICAYRGILSRSQLARPRYRSSCWAVSRKAIFAITSARSFVVESPRESTCLPSTVADGYPIKHFAG